MVELRHAYQGWMLEYVGIDDISKINEECKRRMCGARRVCVLENVASSQGMIVSEVLKNLDTLVSSLTRLTFTLHDNIASIRPPPLFPHLCLTNFINIDWACFQDTIVFKGL